MSAKTTIASSKRPPADDALLAEPPEFSPESQSAGVNGASFGNAECRLRVGVPVLREPETALRHPGVQETGRDCTPRR